MTTKHPSGAAGADRPKSPSRDLPSVAVLGAGHVGPVVARAAVRAGYGVSIAASGDPARIELVTQILAPGARPQWAADATKDADIVVLAIPLHRLEGLDPRLVAGRVVIDMMNYWPPTDGALEPFQGNDAGSSEVVQQMLPGAAVVKTLNHIGYHEIDADRRPIGTPGRRALGVAADVPVAEQLVSEFVERAGFDAVPLGSLSAGRLLQPGGPVFGLPLHRDEFELSIRQGGLVAAFAGLNEEEQ